MDTDSALANAYAALKGGDLASAAARARSAYREPDLTFPALNRLAQLCLELRLLDEAADANARALALDATQPRTWYRHAIIALQRQNLDEARNAFERVVALSPGAPGPLNNLGIVLQQLGQHRLAIAQYEKAVAINPGHAEAWSNLAAATAILGHFDEAIAHAQRAIALKPDYVSPYVHAAFAEADRGRCAEALSWMDRIPANAARSAPVLTARAEILLKFERFEEAFEASRRAVAIEPEYGDARNCLGILLATMEREREAIVEFDRASRLMPNGAMPRARKGIALMQLGEQAEGLQLLDEASAEDPSSATIHYMRATAREFRLGEHDIAAMEALLADERTASVIDRMHLHFALAGAHLKRGNVQAVFPHLTAGNRLKRGTIVYDADAEEKLMADIAGAFPASAFEDSGSTDASSQTAIFVVGMPRSGTTLVEQILASHPAVHGAGELRNFEFAVRRAMSSARLSFPDGLASLGAQGYAAIGREYLSEIEALRGDALRVVDKMPSNALYAGAILKALPGARIVHCRRDPFDTCFSCYAQLFTTGQHYAYDLTELGRYYRAHDAMMAHWRRVLPANAFFEIDYENLVADIEGVSRRLVAFCGLEWSPSCLQFHESRRPVRTASMSQVRQPLYRSSVGRWRPFRAELSPLFDILGPPGQ